MPEGEEPIIVRPGVYPDPGGGVDKLEGICLVIDDKHSWSISTSETPDGKSFTHITISHDSNWMVVPDKLELADGSTFERIAIVRRKGRLTDIIDNSKGEKEIDYTLLPLPPPEPQKPSQG